MPLPTPKRSESRHTFINRFMADANSKKEFPEAKQRTAVAHEIWSRKKRGTK
jgi:hypothetical protein